MANDFYTAMIVEELGSGKFERIIGKRTLSALGNRGTLIKVSYSSLNYKDALSARGHKGITRRYPHTPGVDAAGLIVECPSGKYKIGDKVIVTGYDLGMNIPGGFGEYIRVPDEWIVPIPSHISEREAMIYGTAGFTAGIAVYELINHNIDKDSGKVLVTGASGAVGSLSVAILAKLGYQVTAASRKKQCEFLLQIGASELIPTDDIIDHSGKHLLPGRWIAAIENVGSAVLPTVIRSIKPRGAIAVIGNVTGDKFETSIYPFILRGINLLGIDSAERPMDYRLKIWDLIFNEWRLSNTNLFTKEVSLSELSHYIDLMLIGDNSGKVLVKI